MIDLRDHAPEPEEISHVQPRGRQVLACRGRAPSPGRRSIYKRGREMKNQKVVYTDSAGTKFELIKTDGYGPMVLVIMYRAGGRRWLSDDIVMYGEHRILQIRATSEVFYLYDPDTNQTVPDESRTFKSFGEVVEAGSMALSKGSELGRRSPRGQMDDWFKHQAESQETTFALIDQ